MRGVGGAPSGQCESSSGDTRPEHERCGPALTSPEPDTSKMFNPVPEPCASSVTRVDAYPVSSACPWYTSRITIPVPSRRKLTCGGVRARGGVSGGARSERRGALPCTAAQEAAAAAARALPKTVHGDTMIL